MLYPPEQTAELFDKLPKELRAALLSPETAQYIEKIAQRYKIIEKTSELAVLVGNIILGLLSPEILPRTLENDLAISQDQAEKISQEIIRLILYPVKTKLAEFYEGIDFAPSGVVAKISQQSRKTQADETAAVNDEQADVYREEVG